MVKVICFEGANAVGKSHTIQVVSDLITERGLSYRVYKAPAYSGLLGDRITGFLNGAMLSGHAIYRKDTPESSRNAAEVDFKDVDYIFRVNRDYVADKIQAD